MRGVTLVMDGLVGRGEISTRTPHAGSDVVHVLSFDEACRFQPALPMRGVTLCPTLLCKEVLFQPALPMRGVTLFFGV